jgi:CheY-like chemotaxis protein
MLNLLLADDDLDDCMFFREALDEIPVDTKLTTVNDGVELMHFLSSGKQSLPDGVYLDLNMPKKNGFECLVEIKKMENLKLVPIFIYSTSFDPGVVGQLKEWGASHYIRKPTEFHNLKKVIHKSLHILEGEKNQKLGSEQFVISEI